MQIGTSIFKQRASVSAARAKQRHPPQLRLLLLQPLQQLLLLLGARHPAAASLLLHCPAAAAAGLGRDEVAAAGLAAAVGQLCRRVLVHNLERAGAICCLGLLQEINMGRSGDATVGPNECRQWPSPARGCGGLVLTATALRRLRTPTPVRPLPAALDSVASRWKPRAPAATSSARSAVLEVVVAMLFSLGKRNRLGGPCNRCSIACSDLWMRWERVRRCV